MWLRLQMAPKVILAAAGTALALVWTTPLARSQPVATPQQMTTQIAKIDNRLNSLETFLRGFSPHQFDGTLKTLTSDLAFLKANVEALKQASLVYRGAWLPGDDTSKHANEFCFRNWHGYAIKTDVSPDPDPRGGGTFFTCHKYLDATR